MTQPLEQVLADARGEAAVLRSQGHPIQAKSIDRLADQVAECMRGYLITLSDKEAALRSGWSENRLRAAFPAWEAIGFAMVDERGRRRYRECIVPARAERSTARLAGARGESLRKHG